MGSALGAIATGAMYWLALKGGPWGLLGFIALVPLLVGISGATIVASALWSGLAGLIAFGLTGEWALLFGDHAWLALTLVTSIYLMAFAVGVSVLTSRQRSNLIWIAPAMWAILDWVRMRFPLGGYGLAQLGYSQVGLIWAGLARWGGGLLVSTLLVAINAGIATGIVTAKDSRPSFRAASIWASYTVSLLILGAVVTVVAPGPAAAGSMRITALQPYDFNRALTPSEESENMLLDRLETDTERFGAGSELVVWPEASLRSPDPANDHGTRQAIRRAAENSGAWILANGQPLTEDLDGFVNRNFLFNPDGELVAISDKEKLVPFGEYVPWRSLWRGWVSSTERIQLDGRPGEYLTFRMPSGDVGALICFESTFPDPSRNAVQDGAQLLVVLTNNRSFEWSSLSRQHVAATRMRAIETGRTVVHSAISGISALVTPDGSVVSEIDLFERGALSTDVELRSGLTPYARLGDLPLVGFSFLLVSLALLRVYEIRDAPHKANRSNERQKDNDSSMATKP